MPTESTKEKSIISLGGSQYVALEPGWVEYHKKHFEKHGKKVKVLGNSVLIIIPANMPDLEEKARKIVEGKE